jgi:hypothetical protein
MTQVRDHCLGPARTDGAPQAGGRYTRLFPELPPLAIEPQLLRAVGRAGGLSDATDRGPSEARAVAAGRPVFGQYLAHDLTADRSPLTHHDDAELSGTRAAPGSTWNCCMARGRSPTPISTAAAIRPGCCSAGAGRAMKTTCPATRRASPWRATRDRIRTC